MTVHERAAALSGQPAVAQALTAGAGDDKVGCECLALGAHPALPTMAP